ncbi:MAG: hypothetical protein MK105_00205 [Crocinitomicaceae bacterium]|nr:hypothetical protein [Crocinitomicaceae bacterium]
MPSSRKAISSAYFLSSIKYSLVDKDFCVKSKATSCHVSSDIGYIELKYCFSISIELFPTLVYGN